MNYSDENDKITKLFIFLSTPNQYLWEKLEYAAYNHIKKDFLKYKKGKILDVGCGEGRIEPFLMNYFDSLVLIDEDLDRLKIAKNTLWKHRYRLTFVQSKIEVMPFKNNYFDVIICSHVLQHMFKDSYLRAINNFYKKLNKLGNLILATSITSKDNDSTFIVTEKNGRLIKKHTFLEEKEDFQTKKGALFVRHFSVATLQNLFSFWKIEKFIIYHQFYRDKLLNSEPIIYNHLPTKFPYRCDSADVIFVLRPLT